MSINVSNLKIADVVEFLERCFANVISLTNNDKNTKVVECDFVSAYELPEIKLELKEVALELDEISLSLPEIELVALAA